MVPRYPIPRPRQRSTRLDNCWHHPAGEWKRLIEYENSVDDWSSVDSTLLGSAPGLDWDLNAIGSERHQRHDIPPWLEGQCELVCSHGH